MQFYNRRRWLQVMVSHATKSSRPAASRKAAIPTPPAPTTTPSGNPSASANLDLLETVTAAPPRPAAARIPTALRLRSAPTKTVETSAFAKRATRGTRSTSASLPMVPAEVPGGWQNPTVINCEHLQEEPAWATPSVSLTRTIRLTTVHARMASLEMVPGLRLTWILGPMSYFAGITECREKPIGCDTLNNCGLHATCRYEEQALTYVCRCNHGFFGDGFQCYVEKNCLVDRAMCDPNAQCQTDAGRTFFCQCNSGFVGNGSICREVSRSDGNFLLLNQGRVFIHTGNSP